MSYALNQQAAITAGAVTKLKDSGEYSTDFRQFLQNLMSDLMALRNDLDNFKNQFNTHTHKTPTTNPGATSAPTTDAGGSGSTGGTALALVNTPTVTTTLT